MKGISPQSVFYMPRFPLFASEIALFPQFLTPLGAHNVRWEGTWRELGCLSNTTAFAVREQAGHSLKSLLRVGSIWNNILLLGKREALYGSFGNI